MDKTIEWQKAASLAPQVGAYRLQSASFHLNAGEKNKAREALDLLERQGRLLRPRRLQHGDRSPARAVA